LESLLYQWKERIESDDNMLKRDIKKLLQVIEDGINWLEEEVRNDPDEIVAKMEEISEKIPTSVKEVKEIGDEFEEPEGENDWLEREERKLQRKRDRDIEAEKRRKEREWLL
jgi:hypothetical protein